MTTSDHKAVVAQFHISVPRELNQLCDDHRSQHAGKPKTYAILRLSDVSVEGLPEQQQLLHAGKTVQVVFGFGTAASMILRTEELVAFHCVATQGNSHSSASNTTPENGIVRSNVPSVELLRQSIEAPTPTAEQKSAAIEAGLQDASCTLHVGHIGQHDTEDKLRVLLGKYGRVVSAEVRLKQNNKSWAFVTMSQISEAEALLAADIPALSIAPYSRRRAQSATSSRQAVYSPSMTVRVALVRINTGSLVAAMHLLFVTPALTVSSYSIRRWTKPSPTVTSVATDLRLDLDSLPTAIVTSYLSRRQAWGGHTLIGPHWQKASSWWRRGNRATALGNSRFHCR